jgi:predicted metalloprotease
MGRPRPNSRQGNHRPDHPSSSQHTLSYHVNEKRVIQSVPGVTSHPAVFSVKVGKLSKLSYTKNGLCVMLG